MTAEASSIYVNSNNDVYLAGSMLAGSPHYYTATYWKNGKLSFLTDTSNNTGSDAYSIFIDGSDVYISGSIGTFDTEASYWKNGVLNIVGGSNTYANTISVSDGDVYLGGATLFSTTNNSFSGENATYWKNGTAVNLTNHNNNIEGIVTSIFVSGKTIYAAGSTSNLSYGHNIATLWESNNTNILSNSDYDANVTSIAVAGNDIYVCGSESKNSALPYLATYWKNGIEYTLSTITSDATSIYIFNGDVYIAGDIFYTTNVPTAVYWKNGVLVKVGAPNSSVSSIFVK